MLRFVRNVAVFPLHHVVDVDLIFQQIRNGNVFPERAALLLQLLVAQAMELLVLRWMGNPTVIQQPRDDAFAIALREKREHLPNDGGDFLINDQMPF